MTAKVPNYKPKNLPARPKPPAPPPRRPATSDPMLERVETLAIENHDLKAQLKAAQDHLLTMTDISVKQEKELETLRRMRTVCAAEHTPLLNRITRLVIEKSDLLASIRALTERYEKVLSDGRKHPAPSGPKSELDRIIHGDLKLLRHELSHGQVNTERLDMIEQDLREIAH